MTVDDLLDLAQAALIYTAPLSVWVLVLLRLARRD